MQPNAGPYAPNPTYGAGAVPTASVPPYQPYKAASSSSNVTLLSLFLRAAQMVLALISFSVMASAKQYGLKFTAYKAFKYDLAIMVIVFVYALAQLALDLVELISKSPIGGYLKAYVTAIFDTLLSFLAFGAANAAASISVELYCTGLSTYCGHVKGATAMSFLCWAALVPSQIMSLIIAANFFRSN